VISVQEEMPGASDEAILARACETGRWLVTYDRDYGEMVYSRNFPAPPAILYFRQEPYPPDRPAEWILGLLDNPADAIGYMVVVGEQAIRPARCPSACREHTTSPASQTDFHQGPSFDFVC
jgi:hypothetical protein